MTLNTGCAGWAPPTRRTAASIAAAIDDAITRAVALAAAQTTATHTDRTTGTPATPGGCRYCGTTRQGHHQTHIPGHGFHPYTEPTDAQRLARLRARRTTTTTTGEPS